VNDSRGSQVRIRVRDYLRRGSANPRWLLMDSVSRFHVARRIARVIGSRPVTQHYPLNHSRFNAVDVDSFVNTLHHDGYCAGLVLPAAAVRDILYFADTLPCFGDADKSLGFLYRNKEDAEASSLREFSQATYLNRDGLQPVLDAVARDPLLMGIAASYLQAPPVITGTRMWWTFATGAASFNNSITTSFFHYDKDDYAALRLFFYLSDVDDGRGPHVVVRGSHRVKSISQLVSIRERNDDDIMRSYGRDHLTTITGKVGHGFAEDPFCFHKATRPVSGDRLMIELKYARRDYQSFPAVEPSSLQLIPV
jgi:hypothetical protein